MYPTCISGLQPTAGVLHTTIVESYRDHGKVKQRTLLSKHKKLGFDLKKVVITQICSRFVKPVSKLALFDIAVDVVLYDLTTLRFESTRTGQGELRQFGHRKELRSDCTQIVMGLLTDTEGIPLCIEAHPCNTFEGNTLDGIVDRISEKMVISRFIFRIITKFQSH